MKIFQTIKDILFEKDTPSFESEESEYSESIDANELINNTIKSFIPARTSSSSSRSVTRSVEEISVSERLDKVINNILTDHKKETSKKRKKLINKLLTKSIHDSFVENSFSPTDQSHQNMSDNNKSTTPVSESEIMSKFSDPAELNKHIQQLMELHEKMKREKSATISTAKKQTESCEKSDSASDVQLAPSPAPAGDTLASLIRGPASPSKVAEAAEKAFIGPKKPEKRSFAEVSGRNTIINDDDKKKNDDNTVAEKKSKNTEKSSDKIPNSPSLEALIQKTFPNLKPTISKPPVMSKSNLPTAENLIRSSSATTVSDPPLHIDEGVEQSTITSSVKTVPDEKKRVDSGISTDAPDLNAHKDVLEISSDENDTEPVVSVKKKRSLINTDSVISNQSQKPIQAMNDLNVTCSYTPESSTSNANDDEDPRHVKEGEDQSKEKVDQSSSTTSEDLSKDDSVPHDQNFDHIKELVLQEETARRLLSSDFQFPMIKLSLLIEDGIEPKNCLKDPTLLSDLSLFDKLEMEKSIFNCWPSLTTKRQANFDEFMIKLAKFMCLMITKIKESKSMDSATKVQEIQNIVNVDYFLENFSEAIVTKSHHWNKNSPMINNVVQKPKADFRSLEKEIEKADRINVAETYQRKDFLKIVSADIVAKLRFRKQNSSLLALVDSNTRTRHTALLSQSIYLFDAFLQKHGQFMKLDNRNLLSAITQHYQCGLAFVQFIL